MSRLTCGHIQHMYSWWWVRLSPETCRVKSLRRIKTQLLHLVGLISLLSSRRVLPTVVRRCVWSRNLIMNEEAMASVGLQRPRENNITQKSAVLSYFAVEVWNHEKFKLLSTILFYCYALYTAIILMTIMQWKRSLSKKSRSLTK